HDLITIEHPLGSVRAHARREPLPPVAKTLGGAAGKVERLGQGRVVLGRLTPDVDRLGRPLHDAARPGCIDVVDSESVVDGISEEPGGLRDGRASHVVVEPIAFYPMDQRAIRTGKALVHRRSAAGHLKGQYGRCLRSTPGARLNHTTRLVIAAPHTTMDSHNDSEYDRPEFRLLGSAQQPRT